MSTHALPQQQSLPGADPAVVRDKLLELLDGYGARVAQAGSGAEVNQLVHDYAAACLRELEGVAGDEAADVREYYQHMLDRTSGDACKASS